MTQSGFMSDAPKGEDATALGYTILTLLGLAGVLLVTLAPFTTKPVPHRTSGILFGSAFDSRTSIAAISAADPRARLVDIRWNGRLVFVDYDDVDFPETIEKAGALYMFDAIAAGCHSIGGTPRR